MVSGCPDDLAAALASVDRDLLRGFVAAQRREGLTHGERTICRVLSPLVVPRDLYARIADAATTVMAAIERLVARALIDDELRALLGVDVAERDLYAGAARGKPAAPAVVVGRLDMVVTRPLHADRDSFAFIELNAESPAGLVDQSAIEATLYRLPALRAWLADRCTLQSDVPRALLEALRDTHRAWGGDGDPRIAIVDWPAVDTAAEQDRLCSLFRAAGTFAVRAHPEQLSYADGRLTVEGEPIDLVYRRVLTRDLFARTEAPHPLRRALRDGAVCIANPLHSAIANRKAALAVLSDPAWGHLFSAAQIRALRDHVPWSRVLDRQASDRRELEELVLDRQQDLVIKPNDDYGGRGIVLGWTVDSATWRAAVSTAFAERHIVQQRLHPRRLRFPVFDEQRDASPLLTWRDLAFDCNPFLFRGRVEGAMVRVAEAEVSNVSAGGGVTGLCVYDGAAHEGDDRV